MLLNRSKSDGIENKYTHLPGSRFAISWFAADSHIVNTKIVKLEDEAELDRNVRLTLQGFQWRRERLDSKRARRIQLIQRHLFQTRFDITS